jgi:hypothetical protein
LPKWKYPFRLRARAAVMGVRGTVIDYTAQSCPGSDELEESFECDEGDAFADFGAGEEDVPAGSDVDFCDGCSGGKMVCSCADPGATCKADSDCCNGMCDSTSGLCKPSQLGGPCPLDSDPGAQSGACVANPNNSKPACQRGRCCNVVGQLDPCTVDSDCCGSGVCYGGTCVDLSACVPTGAACGSGPTPASCCNFYPGAYFASLQRQPGNRTCYPTTMGGASTCQCQGFTGGMCGQDSDCCSGATCNANHFCCAPAGTKGTGIVCCGTASNVPGYQGVIQCN